MKLDEMNVEAAPMLSQPSRWRARLIPYLPSIFVLIAAMVYGTVSSPYFLNFGALLVNTGRYVEIGLLALALTIVIINGDIDLSVASNLAVSAATLGLLVEAGVPVQFAALAALAVGMALGAFNALFIIGLGLPSLVVTLATLALYRGLAQIMLGDSAVTAYPAEFVGADQVSILGDIARVPMPLVIFIGFAILFGFLLSRTNFGLSCYLTGSNQQAAKFSGIRTNRTRTTAFLLSGLMAGTAAVMLTSRLGSTLSNVGLGLELLAITVVVLGGTDIFGGRGTILGTVIALFAVMAVRESLVISNVNGQIQDAVVGVILIAAIVVPLSVARIRKRVTAKRLR
jgi:rhamnose transport system permease protein